MTHTKKKSSPVNVIESAWEAFFAEKREEMADREQLAAEGWKTIREIAERVGVPEASVNTTVRRDTFEKKLVKVLYNGVRRTTLFVRPVVK